MELKGSSFTIRGWRVGDEISLQKNADNPRVSDNLTTIIGYWLANRTGTGVLWPRRLSWLTVILLKAGYHPYPGEHFQ